MKSYLNFLKSLEDFKVKTLVYIFFTYFLVLFSYPLLRSAVGAYFYDFYTANEYSLATFLAIVFLIVCIYLSNRFQKSIGIHKLYISICFVSVVLFLGAFILSSKGFAPAAFLLFALKESYIVLLIHLCLAFSNGFFNLEEVKKLFGPIGAIGSIGGILGGQVTANFAKSLGTNVIFFSSLAFIIIAGFTFYKTKKYFELKPKEEDEELETHRQEPIKSIKPVLKFVILICIIVSLSQWVIFIADLQFNIIFEKLITSKDARTAYLGNIYSYINGISLFIQFIIIPYLLARVTNRFIFLSIPIVYSLLAFLTMGFGASSIFISAGVFVAMKASDYSIFSYSKEVLYHGLTNAQKYGAKYVTDMFAYRLSKAIIAAIMTVFTINRIEILNIFQIIFIIIWGVCVYTLFKTQVKEK